MSRRKIKTEHTRNQRKLKKYLYGQGKNDRQWQAHCQRISIKQRKLKRLAEEKKKADEETKTDV